MTWGQATCGSNETGVRVSVQVVFVAVLQASQPVLHVPLPTGRDACFTLPQASADVLSLVGFTFQGDGLTTALHSIPTCELVNVKLGLLRRALTGLVVADRHVWGLVPVFRPGIERCSGSGITHCT